jgi:hypothetical protein
MINLVDGNIKMEDFIEGDNYKILILMFISYIFIYILIKDFWEKHKMKKNLDIDKLKNFYFEIKQNLNLNRFLLIIGIISLIVVSF